MSYLKAEKATAKAAKGMDRVRKTAILTGKNAAVSQGVKYGTAGLVSPPGAGGAALDGAKDYVHGWSDATDAREIAEQ
jgi:hypothetical protein